MKLFSVAINEVMPGRTPEEAIEKFNIQLGDLHLDPEVLTVKELVPHVDFVKIFRLARLLENTDQFDSEDCEVLVQAYANKLGYPLKIEEVRSGLQRWAERFADTDDEDIEDWVN